MALCFSMTWHSAKAKEGWKSDIRLNTVFLSKEIIIFYYKKGPKLFNLNLKALNPRLNYKIKCLN